MQNNVVKSISKLEKRLTKKWRRKSAKSQEEQKELESDINLTRQLYRLAIVIDDVEWDYKFLIDSSLTTAMYVVSDFRNQLYAVLAKLIKEIEEKLDRQVKQGTA